VALGVVLLVGCGRSTERAGGSAPAHVRIAVGGQTQLVYLPTTLARELGFFREEGVDVEIDDFQGGAKALEALLARSADVVTGFYDHTIQMAAEGREITAFVTMLRYSGFVVVVAPPSAGNVTKIEDFKGRIVGVTAPGSSTHMLLTYLLKQHGVPVDSVSVTAIGTAATAIAAVEYGKVAAAVMTEPAFTIMSRRNAVVRILADLRHPEGVKEVFGTSSYPAAVLYANADWIRTNRETAGRLARAIQRTLAWMHTHTAQEIAERMPAAFRGQDASVYVDALANSMPMYSPDGIMTPEGAEAVHKVLVQSMDKVRSATIDLSKTYTNEFLTGARPQAANQLPD
jgi:NitT/TauT family transport system substrate-binding protein